MKIDLCPDRKDYYSQLNNEIDPYSACQVTAMVMGLDIGKFGLDPINNIQCSYKQPEDKLRWYIFNNPEVQNYYHVNWPNTKIPAPEYAGCMVYAVNKLYGKSIVYFEEKLNLSKIADDLMARLPVYASMKYPENRNNAGNLSPIDGHIVLIVGANDEEILINDSYKNHLTGEKDGFKNVYLPDEFIQHSKGRGIRYKK